MSRLYSYLGIFLFSLALLSCNKQKVSGNGAVITEERNVKNFSKVEINGNRKLSITGGTDFKVIVKGYENLLPKLQTVLENGTLKIKFETGVNVSNDNTEISITMPDLVGISSQGNSEVKVKGPFIGSDILTIEKNGKGDVTVEQCSVMSAKVSLTGNSNFHGFGLNCQTALVSVTGNGNAEISVSKTLNASINGNGNIYYKGNPQVTQQVTGNGAVIKK